MTAVVTRKKLIEVALPLEAINVASAREKSIRHGHPSTLHLWWARRPLAAARAVIFAQMVDDPSAYVDTLLDVKETRREAEAELRKRRAVWEKRVAEYAAATGQEEVAVPEPGPEPVLEDCAADIERERLFKIIEELVLWENTTNEAVLEKARAEIWQSWRRACADNAGHPRAAELFDRHKLPAFHDPFAGGGSLPLEAQRLGLEAHASDLNPVAVLICKAMIEIPPKFAGRPPVNPDRDLHRHWKGAEGLADDVRWYGRWMRDEAGKRIGHLYPKVDVTAAMAAERPDLKPYVGRKLTVIAWLWARTVKSPNPAFRDVDVPLASTFVLSRMKGNEASVVPAIEDGDYRFTVAVGNLYNQEVARSGTSAGKRGGFRCLMSGTPIGYKYIRDQGSSGLMGARLMAIVAEGPRGRIYLSPTVQQEGAARMANPDWVPETSLYGKCRVNVANYGIDTFGDLFTPRQLTALDSFSKLVLEARDLARADAIAAGLQGKAQDYSDAITVYLALAVSSLSDRMSTICTWDAGGATWGTKTRSTFARQALPMSWDFAEVNPLSSQSGSIDNSIEYTTKGIVAVATDPGMVSQANAPDQTISLGRVISTDPPYYDNIEYADLSDYFYVWLRRSLQGVLPDLFGTVASPKTEELIAAPHRHEGKEGAERFFLKGMKRAISKLADQAHPSFPLTIYYAFKQSETEKEGGTTSTGWETFLDAVINAGLAISGTWPVRTELASKVSGIGRNMLASSIVLVCRLRSAKRTATRREYLNALKAELPTALAHLQRGNIAPVDLAQAAIGPGMAVYTRFAQVVDAEGNQLSVREALALINQVLDEVLAEQEGDFDADSRFAIAWFEQVGFNEGQFGVADVLARAKNTSVEGLRQAGVLASGGGKVRLLRPGELPADWDPETDPRLTVWEAVHHLIRLLEAGGETAAAGLAAKLGAKAEVARELAYRLYTIAERKKRAADALAYNALVQSWPEIMRLAREQAATTAGPSQAELLV